MDDVSAPGCETGGILILNAVGAGGGVIDPVAGVGGGGGGTTVAAFAAARLFPTGFATVPFLRVVFFGASAILYWVEMKVSFFRLTCRAIDPVCYNFIRMLIIKSAAKHLRPSGRCFPRPL